MNSYNPDDYRNRPHDICHSCKHQRMYHYAVNDGEETDAWCEVKDCVCTDIRGFEPGWSDRWLDPGS